MFVGNEGDRLALRELVDTYSDAVMRYDADAWIDTWAEDGEWAFRGRTVTGKSQILSTWKAAMQDFRGVVFLCQPGSVVVDGDRASMITHTFEHLVLPDGTIKLQSGLYKDTAVRTEKWRFARREFTARELKI
jgi:uncharacterized protein (TIGR02246 family)